MDVTNETNLSNRIESFRTSRARLTVSPSPRPTSRGKSRRSLKRFINTSLLLFGDSDAGFWDHLSDEELKDRLAHVLLKPQGERAGFKDIIESDLLESFVTGEIGLGHSSISSKSQRTDKSFVSAATLLERMWRKVKKSLRPLLLRECRRVHRLQISDPGAVRHRSFLSSAECLCISILNESLLNRLQAGLEFEGGAEFFSAISYLRVEENIIVNVGGGETEFVIGVKMRVLDFISVSILCAVSSFYGLGVKCEEVPFDDSESGVVNNGARRPPVDVTVYERPARTREARQERATIKLLCRQLSTTQLLPADYDTIADPDPEEEFDHSLSSGDDGDEGGGGRSNKALYPADYDIPKTNKDLSSYPWGLVPDLVSLHIRTLSEQTFGLDRGRFS
jgi:hypothetical protein